MSKEALLATTAPFAGAEESRKSTATTASKSTAAAQQQQSAPRDRSAPNRKQQRSRQRRNIGSDDDGGDDDGGGNSDGDESASRARKLYLTTAQLCKRWGGCSHMFIERRLKTDPRMPRPMKLGGRGRLFDLDQNEAYERGPIYAGGDEAA